MNDKQYQDLVEEVRREEEVKRKAAQAYAIETIQGLMARMDKFRAKWEVAKSLSTQNNYMNVRDAFKHYFPHVSVRFDKGKGHMASWGTHEIWATGYAKREENAK